MRATAIILAGMAVSMAFDRQFTSIPFLLSISLACWLRHRSGKTSNPFRRFFGGSHGRHSDTPEA